MLVSHSTLANGELARIRKHGSAALTLYLFSLLTAAMIWSHPFYLLALLTYALLVVARFDLFDSWLGLIKLAVFFGIIIILVNLLVSRSGETIIFETAPFPVYGKVMISVEALIFSIVMCLKLFLILTYSWLFGVIIGADRVLTLFSRVIPRSALIVSLATLAVPRMKRRLGDTYMAMIIRGAELSGGGMFARIKFVQPLTKALVIGALEDSWSTAEALNARAYGVGKRTAFFAERSNTKDWMIITAALAAIVGSIAAVILGSASGVFFPVLSLSISKIDYLAASIFLSASLLPLFMVTPEGDVQNELHRVRA